jgi:hypothetical protein
VAFTVVAIWRLAIGRLFVRKSKFVSLEIDELKINRLQVGDLIVTDKFFLPDSAQDEK